MANRYATKAGNWSDTTVWDGGTLPGASDTVRPSGFTVTIDQDISVTALRNDASSPATAGGQFLVTGNRTITASSGLTSTGSTVLVVFSGTTGTLLTVNANLTLASLSSTGAHTINVTGAGTLTVNGNCVGVGANNGAYCINNASTGTVNVNGNVSGGGSSAFGVYNAAGGTVNIVGTVTAGQSLDGHGAVNAGTGTMNITGNCYGGSQSPSAGGVAHYGTGTINITGDVIGGSVGSSQIGVYYCGLYIRNTGGGTINITGNVYGGAGVNCTGIYMTGTGATTVTITVSGNLVAGAGGSAVNGVISGNKLIVNGNLLSSGAGFPAIGPACVLINSTSPLQHTYRVNNSGVAGVERSLFTGGVNLGQPSTSNVRYGTTFGVSGEYAGSLRVPSPSYVSQGVLTDNTVGTLNPSLTAADIRSAIGLASANLDDQLAGILSAATGVNVVGFTSEALDQLRAAEIDLSQWDPEAEPAKIYRGIDHLQSTGNHFGFTNVTGNWPNLNVGTIRMELLIEGVTAIAGSGVVVNATGPNQQFYIQVLRTAFDGSAIKDKTGIFRCVRIDGSGNRFPLASGVATLFANTAPAT